MARLVPHPALFRRAGYRRQGHRPFRPAAKGGGWVEEPQKRVEPQFHASRQYHRGA